MTIEILLCIFANKFIVMNEKIKWVSPNTITGPPAEGDKYFRRDYINEEFWREIEKGSHILFTAPRRVGKTSIMKDLAKNCPEEYICHFENIESEKTQKQFFKRLFELLVNELKPIKKYKNLFNTWFKKRGIEEISIEVALKFNSKEVNYKDELLSLLNDLQNIDQKVVLFLDEFSEVITSIKRTEGKDVAIDTLHTIRAIRQSNDFKFFTLVLAGSIGLEQVVIDLDRLKLINDLHPILIKPLNKDEARHLIRQLCRDASMKFDEEIEDYLFNKVGEYLIPYFVQQILERCDHILRRNNNTVVTTDVIDIAFEDLLKNDKNLNDWEARLKPPYLTKNSFEFCKQILTICAHRDRISIQEIYNLSAYWKQADGYMDWVKMLTRDGYIFEDNGFYSFLSPVIKIWWKRQHPEFEIKEH